jgi:two-component system cell cycle sensor histidine kinase/response regulator CckA
VKAFEESATPAGFVDPKNVSTRLGQIERREWWLWASAVFVTLLLTLALASFLAPVAHHYLDDFDALAVHPAIRSLIGLVLLFDLYTVHQQRQIVHIRRQVLEQENLFRLITENAGDMIAVIDSSGNRVYASPSYEKVLGYSSHELLGSALDQIHPEDRPLVDETANEARRTGFGRRIEYRMRHKDGTWRYLESTASAIRDDDSVLEKLVVVNRDITARRRLEEQFRQAQKMEAVGRLSGGIAHDFNNLLGVIIGYAEILEDRIPAADREAVDEILKAGQRAASLTRQLLAFSRQQLLEPKVLDLNQVVSETEKMLRRLIGEDISFVTRLEPQLGAVKADPGQIGQILMNLVVNARDAMPEGGELLIETANVVMDEVFVQRYPYPVKTGSYAQLAVTDTGVGMDLETQAHIFEPFFTTKGKDAGTGLGLATVYGVVKQSGGYIEAVSEPSMGTTFKIYLPRVDEAVTPVHAPEPKARLEGNETILLVEDEVALRGLAHQLLTSLGYKVLEAARGSEALGLSEGVPKIDLLLTDVVMPDMNGRTLAQQLLQSHPEIKVIYMSGYTGQAVGNHGIIHPDGVFLPKPFTREVLASKIRQTLDLRSPQTSLESRTTPRKELDLCTNS